MNKVQIQTPIVSLIIWALLLVGYASEAKFVGWKFVPEKGSYEFTADPPVFVCCFSRG